MHNLHSHWPHVSFVWMLCLIGSILSGCLPGEDPSVKAAEVRSIADAPNQHEAVSEDSTTARLFSDLMDKAKAEHWREESLGDVMIHVGQWFEGKPYVAGTLDESAFEKLVINLDGFDCVTFVESVLALSRTIKEASYRYDTFEQHMRSQRYRGGAINGYCSRLHYFSEWILDNEKRNSVRNITREIGGERLPKTLNFMSDHRSSYPHLADDSLFAEIKVMEQKLQDLVIYYIPQERISSTYGKLEAGDVIALATDIGGLDVAHTGLVFKHEDGSAGLMHASTARGVIVSPDLQAYVENNKRQVGIVVARPLDTLRAE